MNRRKFMQALGAVGISGALPLGEAVKASSVPQPTQKGQDILYCPGAGIRARLRTIWSSVDLNAGTPRKTLTKFRFDVERGDICLGSTISYRRTPQQDMVRREMLLIEEGKKMKWKIVGKDGTPFCFMGVLIDAVYGGPAISAISLTVKVC